MIKTFLSFILIVLIFLSTLGLSLYQIQKPEFLSEQARRTNLYGRLTGNLSKLTGSIPVEKSALTGEDMADILKASIDSETFYSFLDQYLKAHIDWLTGRSANLDFRYSTVAIKQTAREKAVDRLKAKYDNLPICTATQAKTWKIEGGLPACQLPAGNVRSSEIEGLIGAEIDKAFENLSDEAVSKPTPKLEMIRTQVTRSLGLVRLIWGITIGFLLLFLAIFRRKAFLSLAFIFLLTGLIEAAFGLIAWDWVGRIVIDLLPAKQAATLPFIIDIITGVLDVLKKSLANTSIILLVIGGVFLLLAIFHRPKKDQLAIPAR